MPLNRKARSIRLLEVVQRGDLDLIECKLHNMILSSNLSHTTLSYTWDRDGQFRNIQCNGQLMVIGINLWYFLLRFRFRMHAVGKATLICIYAICVDQGNAMERNHQVSQMREIYSGVEQSYFG
jgi:hypothetical protein